MPLTEIPQQRARCRCAPSTPIVAVLLLVSWLPIFAVGVVLTMTVLLSFIGVPLLMVSGAPIAVAVRLLRGNALYRPQHVRAPLVSALIVAASGILVLVFDVVSRNTGTEVLLALWTLFALWLARQVRSMRVTEP